jgi:hypothetical protein
MTTAGSCVRTAMLGSALALTLALVPGCGSDDSSGSARSEEDEIKQVFDAWQASFIAGDGKAVCSRLTASGKREILAAKASLQGGGTAASCEEVVRAIVRRSDEAGLDQQPSRAVSVRIEGDTATAMVSDAGRKPQPVKFIKQDGEWKLPSAGFGSQ